MENENIENIKEEITQPQPTENFPIKKKKPWLMVILIILLIISLGTVGIFGYTNYLLKKQIQPKKDMSATDISPTPYLMTNPTKIPDINISIGDLEWLRYEPNCDNLKNNIIIYYPKGWLFKEFAHVTDNENAGTPYECQVLFRYGAQPQSPQSYFSGELAGIDVVTWVDKLETAEDYTNLIKKRHDEEPVLPKITLSNQIINNQSYIRMDNDDDSGYGDYQYVTKKGDRFFLVSFTPNIPENTNSKIPIITNIELINQEFLNRLKII